jgi:hypothetical protein
MKLFTKEIEERLIKNRKATIAADGADLQHKPVVKLFDPFGAATWLLTEYDPEREEAFGLCDLGMGCPELGYVSIAELRELKIMGAPRIERDMYWQAKQTLNEYADMARANGGIVYCAA